MAVFDFTVGLKQDGSVITTICDERGNILNIDWTDIVDIAASNNLIVGIKSDGTVLVLSKENTKTAQSIAKDVSEWTGIVDVACNNSCVIGLKANGTVVAAGGSASSRETVSEWREIEIVKN